MPNTKPTHKSIIPKLLPSLLGIIILMSPQIPYAQYALPKSEILVKNGVRVIHVAKTPLRMEDWEKKDISDESFDRRTLGIASYFINSNGRVDSVYRYYGVDALNYDRDIFTYTNENRLTEIKTITPKGEIWLRKLVEMTPNKEWHLRCWQRGVLELEVKSTSDSITYETITYRIDSSTKSYYITYYDFENDVKKETSYSDGEVLAERTYQWISNNGIPSNFIYTRYVRANAKEKSKHEISEFLVAEDGHVINKLNGLFTDPFHSYNYFSRYEPFKGISHPFESFLTTDTLVSEKEVSELYRFDGTSIIYRYEMSYEKYEGF